MTKRMSSSILIIGDRITLAQLTHTVCKMSMSYLRGEHRYFIVLLFDIKWTIVLWMRLGLGSEKFSPLYSC